MKPPFFDAPTLANQTGFSLDPQGFGTTHNTHRASPELKEINPEYPQDPEPPPKNQTAPDEGRGGGNHKACKSRQSPSNPLRPDRQELLDRLDVLETLSAWKLELQAKLARKRIVFLYADTDTDFGPLAQEVEDFRRVSPTPSLGSEAGAMTTALTKYDAACRALAEAKAVDEVKDIRDLAVAMATYARQAKNHDLEADAIELRMRATRRLGEIVAEQRRTVGLSKGTAGRGRPSLGGFSKNPPKDDRPTLESQGINKNLAQQARTFSVLPAARFEERVAEAREVARGGIVDKAVKRHRRKAIEADATDHPNAPHELREIGNRQKAKERRLKKRETLQHYHSLLATLPRNVEGARRFYLEIVSRHVINLDAEMNLVIDGLQRIADRQKGAAA